MNTFTFTVYSLIRSRTVLFRAFNFACFRGKRNIFQVFEYRNNNLVEGTLAVKLNAQ